MFLIRGDTIINLDKIDSIALEGNVIVYESFEENRTIPADEFETLALAAETYQKIVLGLKGESIDITELTE